MTARAAGYAGERRPGRRAWRRQLPVSSPVSWAALAGGLHAALRGGRARRDRDALVASLAGRFGAAAALLTDSGTSALALAISGALRGRSDTPVAVPAFACYDVATAAAAAGVPALLYDVEPRSLTPDLASVGRALRQGAGAVVVAHLYGYPGDLGDVIRMAREAGAVVIEDAAQADGATVRGSLAGTQAHFGVLSFGRGKGWTGGGGGALLAFDGPGADLVDRARAELRRARPGWGALAALGGQHLLARPGFYALPAALPFLRLGETVYRAPHAPRGLARASAGILTRTRPLADAELAVRRRNAERLSRALRGDARSGLQAIDPQPSANPSYLRLPVLAPAGNRRTVCDRRAARLGIAPSYPRPLGGLPAFAPRCGNAGERFPGASDLAARLCTLPTHGQLTADDLEDIETWIRSLGDRW